MVYLLENPLSLSGSHQRPFSLEPEVLPSYWLNQFFINQSEVMENNFYTTLRREMLGSAATSLGTEIGISIHSA